MIIMYAMKQAFLTKVSASRKCLKAKKTCDNPFPIGGKRHHTNQSQNYMANHMI